MPSGSVSQLTGSRSAVLNRIHVDAEDDRASVSTNPSHRSSFLVCIVNELFSHLFSAPTVCHTGVRRETIPLVYQHIFHQILMAISWQYSDKLIKLPGWQSIG